MSAPTVLVGSTYGPYEAHVDHDAAIAYALATNDPNPAYLEGGVVPPAFTVALLLPVFREAGRASIPPGAIQGVRGGVHGEHDLHLHAPVEAGATIRFLAKTHSCANTPAGARVTQKIEVTGGDGRPLVDHYWSTIFIGGTLVPQGPALADHAFPEDARARTLGRETIAVTGDQSYRYAGVSADHNPMHIDDEAARRVGFPRKFLQGLCTFAMCGRAVVERAAAGDPRRLTRLAVRFSAPVFLRTELDIDVYDAGPVGEGGRAVAFEATNGDRPAIRHGRAELAGS